MHNHHHQHHHNGPRHIVEEVTTLVQPVRRVEDPSPVEAVLDKRSPILAPRAKDTCPPGDDSPRCEKPQGSNALPIALASTIPIVIAIIVLIFLHRRNRKKQALEDMDVKHRSLDFGLDHTVPRKGKKGKKGAAEMGERPRGHAVGMSMDMNLGSPYLLPAGMNGSHESFHSLSRSIKDKHDPYRPVTHRSNDDPYTRGLRPDNSSVYTGSSRGTDQLLRGASPMGKSIPQRSDSIPVSTPDTVAPEIKYPEPVHSSDSSDTRAVDPLLEKSSGIEQKPMHQLGNSASTTNLPTLVESDHTISQGPQARDSTSTRSSRPSLNGGLPTNPRPPRLQSMEASLHQNKKSIASVSSDYGDNFKVTPPSPIVETTIELPPVDHNRQSLDTQTPPLAGQQQKAVGLGVDGLEGSGNKRFSMSIRPLPPDDPTENPEERANRIRSFYREYFDDSKPDPVGHYGDYYEDYSQEYLDGAVFDPDTGNFVMTGAPYAQPITRRAMTPPPRAPPRMGPKGHFSSGSTARFMPPRGQSSMSARGAPRKPLPPPTVLKSLPTPHLLGDDSNLFTALDFAPPVSYRDRQAGRRPDSPLGTPRPYSPAVRAHTPLVSPFAELKAMPSPHLLRKSGTFTGLDFAPNAHLLKSPDSNSDAHSIMSGRSGISQMQLHNIRAGAYRISRIPKDVVGTKDDISTALKPKWDLSVPA